MNEGFLNYMVNIVVHTLKSLVNISKVKQEISSAVLFFPVKSFEVNLQTISVIHCYHECMRFGITSIWNY